MEVFLVVRNVPCGYEGVGVFSTRVLALKACGTDPRCFIATMTLDQIESREHPGKIEYPNASKEYAACQMTAAEEVRQRELAGAAGA